MMHHRCHTCRRLFHRGPTRRVYCSRHCQNRAYRARRTAREGSGWQRRPARRVADDYPPHVIEFMYQRAKYCKRTGQPVPGRDAA